MDPKLFVLYENEDWMPPLRRELERAELPYEEWFVHEGSVNLGEEPPVGIFFNRMSPSAHTRGHLESADLTRAILAWLEGRGRRVINGSRAFALEVSKVHQYEALRRAGLRVPHTIAVVGGPEELKRAAHKMPLPFITKHNCGGKGLGVVLFWTLEEFDRYVHSDGFVPSPDSVMLLQEYVESREPFINPCGDRRRGVFICGPGRHEPRVSALSFRPLRDGRRLLSHDGPSSSAGRRKL